MLVSHSYKIRFSLSKCWFIYNHYMLGIHVGPNGAEKLWTVMLGIIVYWFVDEKVKHEHFTTKTVPSYLLWWFEWEWFPYRFIWLNTWSLVVGTVWEGLGDGALLNFKRLNWFPVSLLPVCDSAAMFPAMIVMDCHLSVTIRPKQTLPFVSCLGYSVLSQQQKSS